MWVPAATPDDRQAEFSEVYITDARIPDAHRLGAVGDDWRVAMTTLMNRQRTGNQRRPRASARGDRRRRCSCGPPGPDLHTPVLRDRLLPAVAAGRGQRLTLERSRASATTGGPGPEARSARWSGRS